MKDEIQKSLDKLLTIKEASDEGIPLSTIYHAINFKGLKVYMRGKTKMVLLKDIMQMLKEAK